jgi:hypothetical protein
VWLFVAAQAGELWISGDRPASIPEIQSAPRGAALVSGISASRRESANTRYAFLPALSPLIRVQSSQQSAERLCPAYGLRDDAAAAAATAK